ncbi:MAG: hypothetical protein ACLFVU_14565 [Phycisphaerae bacterium]
MRQQWYEFGAVGVDGQLVARGNWGRYEINKGNLFCICTKTDFIQALQTIAGDRKTDADLGPGLRFIELVDENLLDKPPRSDTPGFVVIVFDVDKVEMMAELADMWG